MNRFYRQGEVVAVSGNKADIQLSISGFCSGTHKCAQTVFIKGLSPDRNKVRVENTIGAQVGEKVIVEILSPGFYRALFFVFILPLVALLLGCVLGIKLAIWMGASQKSELYAGVCAAIFFCVSLLASRFVDRSARPQYVIHHRIDESLNCDNCSLLIR
jgi:sigma-E factor negative regulatory protein RseC